MKEHYRIGKLAEQLEVKRFVIRFWEKEFEITSQRTPGGQRFYLQGDYDQFKLIKKLLYEQGFTIAGAKKTLNQEIKNTAQILSTSSNTLELSLSQKKLKGFSNQINTLQKQLIKLRDLL